MKPLKVILTYDLFSLMTPFDKNIQFNFFKISIRVVYIGIINYQNRQRKSKLF